MCNVCVSLKKNNHSMTAIFSIGTPLKGGWEEHCKSDGGAWAPGIGRMRQEITGQMVWTRGWWLCYRHWKIAVSLLFRLRKTGGFNYSCSVAFVSALVGCLHDCP